MASIVVTGYMIRHPVAGNILAYLHYVLGLHRLGHRVVYLEESGWPYSCYDPLDRGWHNYPHNGLRIVRTLLRNLGAPIPVLYVDRESGGVDGADPAELRRIIASADLLLNVGGVCWLPELELCPRRALIDLDPLFTQVSMFGAKTLDRYDTHFSYGANIGRPECTIPKGDIEWIATVPPVVIDLWEWALPTPRAPMTTIANWSAYGTVEHMGEIYGQKDVEFIRLLDLPSRTAQPLELAISGADEPTRESLRSAGWSVRDAGEEVSRDMTTYRAYIRSSHGELSAAKHAYVKTGSGWFSDRSVCYLAAGLPVILQDTGFSRWLPTGEGVLAFTTIEEAAEAIERVNASYESHRRAAREIARRTFDHTVVLPRLLDLALERTKERPMVEGGAG